MKYLLDTCIISELAKANHNKQVVSWLRDQDPSCLFLSYLTNREPMDYTRWRAQNMYVGESVHDVAERASASAAMYFESQGRAMPSTHH